ncbi:hypothetical protein PCASD_18847 [Puccinia coronata f. sp. avenae]|uniref:Uncharacterized protein n=1 Tax=Puccinia coronata f. sp. avenae TaxID=200324 RepID=A0A2N5SG70_9BASI|nr:hypothetical protein PCASD_18847 [Puccinia coronata f. sp. avenae]
MKLPPSAYRGRTHPLEPPVHPAPASQQLPQQLPPPPPTYEPRAHPPAQESMALPPAPGLMIPGTGHQPGIHQPAAQRPYPPHPYPDQE